MQPRTRSSNKNLLGPNTAAPRQILRKSCILCAGEDRKAFVLALREAGAGTFQKRNAYRGYEFWQTKDFCAILCGIGTGCLEPLLWEVLSPRIVTRIVLVGSAGGLPGAVVKLGKAYAIDKAWSGGTGIDQLVNSAPLEPRWRIPERMPRAGSVSTDFYYGFGPRLLSGEYPIVEGHLHTLYRKSIRNRVEMCEMEVAQFYYFCRHFGSDDLQYLAIKSPANPVGDDDSQLPNTHAALCAVVKAGIKLLGA